MTNKKINFTEVLEVIAIIHSDHQGLFGKVVTEFNDGKSKDICVLLPNEFYELYFNKKILKSITPFPRWDDLTDKAKMAYTKALEVFEKELYRL